MGKLIQFRSIKKAEVSFENSFYGYRREYHFDLEGQEFLIEARKHSAQPHFQIEIKVGDDICLLTVNQLPSLSFFSKNFEGIHLQDIPQQFQLITLKTALGEFVHVLEKKLQNSIEILSISNFESAKFQYGIQFVLSKNRQESINGVLCVPETLLVILAKNFATPAPCRTIKSIQFPFHICVGSTALSKEDYVALQEQDIILMDEHILHDNQNFNIMGLPGVKGTIANNQVCVSKVEKI